MSAELKKLMEAERRTYKALMNDPAVIDNPGAGHTPELWAAYQKAAEAERKYRASNGL